MKAAIIPARGGSKRIPHKNIKPFLGKPIITYPIQAALESGLFDIITVTTDDDEIASIAEGAGAQILFKRPRELATDATCIIPVMEHAINTLKTLGYPTQEFCCINATAPLLHQDYLLQGFNALISSGSSSAFSVASFPFPIQRALQINQQGFLEMVWPEHEHSHSQNLRPAYHDAGQFYWFKTERFLEQKKFYAPDSVAVILPRHLAQDIDTLDDWEQAELLYLAVQHKKQQNS